MAGPIREKLLEMQRKSRAKYSHDIVDPEERKKSQHYQDWVDHGILRYRWHNFSEFAPGMYRSNHPNHERFVSYRDMGIKTVLNLRGKTHHSHYYFEAESCEKLGMSLIDIPMSARTAPTVDTLVELMDILESLSEPTLMHCKSGADRTGIAAAIYLMHILDRPVEEARKMLSFDFLHIKFSATGILDYVIDKYARRVENEPIPFRTWVMSEYEPLTARAEFDAMGFWERNKL